MNLIKKIKKGNVSNLKDEFFFELKLIENNDNFVFYLSRIKTVYKC